jgi:hypothetical protein
LTFDEALQLLTSASAGPAGHVRYRITSFFYKSDERPVRVVAFADGKCRFLSLPLSNELATALLTADGSEPVDEREFSQVTEPQLDYAKCYAFAAFVLLAVLPGRRLFVRKQTPAADEQELIIGAPSKP